MPLYRVLDDFCLGPPHGDVWTGDVVELEERFASVYVYQRRLQLETQAPAHQAPPVVTNQDPTPARRTRRRGE